MNKIFILFIFLLPPLYLLYSIFVYFKTKVPYVATPKKYFSIIFENMNITPESVVYELGCGKGDFLFAAEKFSPKKLIGFELSFLHLWYVKIKSKILKSKVKVYCKDFFKADIGGADIIYIFLVKPVVIKLWKKIEKEAKSGALIVVLSDKIPGVECEKIVKTNPGKEKSSNLYIYKKK